MDNDYISAVKEDIKEIKKDISELQHIVNGNGREGLKERMKAIEVGMCKVNKIYYILIGLFVTSIIGPIINSFIQ